MREIVRIVACWSASDLQLCATSGARQCEFIGQQDSSGVRQRSTSVAQSCGEICAASVRPCAASRAASARLVAPRAPYNRRPALLQRPAILREVVPSVSHQRRNVSQQLREAPPVHARPAHMYRARLCARWGAAMCGGDFSRNLDFVFRFDSENSKVRYNKANHIDQIRENMALIPLLGIRIRTPGCLACYLAGTCAWLQPVFQEPGASR
ncbi:hypothetical protein F511_28189 [Dorcoceras hygrometricum]|uniref:Uncharacterized protein n=1 Tax=Dorcoceras hygrometricum TaxID=472368 RepID=A0A2Z7A4K4_9LAMI|nr:hypothetical protein F511_28189 [Dorcoceras hygrometricum]